MAKIWKRICNYGWVFLDPMDFLSRYLAGETEAVYADIEKLGIQAFDDKKTQHIHSVLTETFKRVAFNIEVIVEELKANDYKLFDSKEHNFQKAYHHPLGKTDSMLKDLLLKVSKFGHIPLSIQYFYRIVGGVNFAWDYENYPDVIWNSADPLQIASLDAVHSQVMNKFWVDEMNENLEYGCSNAFLELAADELHKDNISGGPAYKLEIQVQPTIDSRLINEPNNTTFINYLRICFDNCGFPGVERNGNPKLFDKFEEKVKPRLLPI